MLKLVSTYHGDILYMVRTLNTHEYRFIPVKTFVSKSKLVYCTYMGLLHVLFVWAFVWAYCNRVSILVKGKVEVFYVIITSILIVTGKYISVHTVQQLDKYRYILNIISKWGHI